MVARSGDTELELGLDAPVADLASLSLSGHESSVARERRPEGGRRSQAAVGFLIWYRELTTAVHSSST